jgi:hypothetical protein
LYSKSVRFFLAAYSQLKRSIFEEAIMRTHKTLVLVPVACMRPYARSLSMRISTTESNSTVGSRPHQKSLKTATRATCKACNCLRWQLHICLRCWRCLFILTTDLATSLDAQCAIGCRNYYTWRSEYHSCPLAVQVNSRRRLLDDSIQFSSQIWAPH